MTVRRTFVAVAAPPLAGIGRGSTIERDRIMTFEAFDENRKGGDHPNEVEEYWGLYRADRSPKPAMEGK